MSQESKNAIISVYDKTQLVPFAARLVTAGWKVYSTGGTKVALEQAQLDAVETGGKDQLPEFVERGINKQTRRNRATELEVQLPIDYQAAVTGVEELTGREQMLDGRVKTLHENVHAGILAHNDEQWAYLKKNGIPIIDMVVVNFYPFKDVVERQHVTFEDATDNIDIGGPTMVRAAAKNSEHVIVVVDTNDYLEVIRRVGRKLDTPAWRKALAAKAFAYVADYDHVIAAYFARFAKGRPRSARTNKAGLRLGTAVAP